MKRIPLGACKMWSLSAGGLYINMVFRARLTVLPWNGSKQKQLRKHSNTIQLVPDKGLNQFSQAYIPEC